MRGQYEIHTHPAAMALAFGLDFPPEIHLHYNIAPPGRCQSSAYATAGVNWLRSGGVSSRSGPRNLDRQQDDQRGKTVATAPAFRAAFKNMRCLIPASGFYEWEKLDAKTKQPMHIEMKDGAPFAFAGSWSRWRPKDGEQPDTCTIITGEPNELWAPIYNRIPVILASTDYARWLDLELPMRQRCYGPTPPTRCARTRFQRASTRRRTVTRA